MKTDNAKILIGVDAGYQADNSTVIAQNGTRGSDEGGNVFAYTGYAKVDAGGFTFMPEVFGGTIDYDIAGTSDGEADVFGYALLASYKIGNFEPVARYAYIDADDQGIDHDDLIRRATPIDDRNNQDELDSYYIGFNYYLKGNDIKLSMGYEYAKSEGSTESSTSGIRTRLQLLF